MNPTNDYNTDKMSWKDWVLLLGIIVLAFLLGAFSWAMGRHVTEWFYDLLDGLW